LARLTDGGLDLPRRNAVAEAGSNRRQLLSALIIGRPEQTVFFSHFMKCEMLSLEIDRCANPTMNKGAVKCYCGAHSTNCPVVNSHFMKCELVDTFTFLSTDCADDRRFPQIMILSAERVTSLVYSRSADGRLSCICLCLHTATDRSARPGRCTARRTSLDSDSMQRMVFSLSGEARTSAGGPTSAGETSMPTEPPRSSNPVLGGETRIETPGQIIYPFTSWVSGWN